MDVVTVQIPTDVVEQIKTLEGCHNLCQLVEHPRGSVITHAVCQCDRRILNERGLTLAQRRAIMSVLKAVRGR